MEIHSVGVPVVSVGNITMGGTGKTPLVAWLARWLQQRGVRVAVISRGYKAHDGTRNDEALELEQRLPDVPHLQNPDRVTAARTAVEEFGAQLILLDDGFQHRRLHRDLNIVLLDALEPFGFEHVFPRGMLREPLSQLRRAQIVCLSRADAISSEQRQAIHTRVRRLAPGASWAELVHAPEHFLAADLTTESIGSLTGQPVLAFCGIGNPQGFRHTLHSCRLRVVDFREFPDHHAYSRDDIQRLDQWAGEQKDVAAVLCTHKDLVKLGVTRLGSLRLFALAIGAQFLTGQREVEQQLEQFRPGGSPTK